MSTSALPTPMSSRSSQIGEAPSSSPCPPSSASTRQKGKPTITPRSFGRFFAPKRRSLRDAKEKSRNALHDISPSAINARLYRQGSPKAGTRPQIFDEDENPALGSNNLSKRRRGLASPETSPERTPSRRQPKRRRPANLDHGFLDISADGAPEFTASSLRIRTLPCKVKRSEYREVLGSISNRELGNSTDPYRRAVGNYSQDWRSQVGAFCSSPDDVCLNRSVTPDSSLVIPFCVAACRTNPLVAVGDEDGYIKLLDTSRDAKQSFRKPFLTFRVHTNALVDIEFTSDDSLLATASGDQTGRIVDVRTQQCTYELDGHMTSVKQIRFQPGSGNNVVATSSRAGKVIIYDLRCKSYGECSDLRSVRLDGSGSDSIDESPRTAGMKYAARVASFHLTSSSPSSNGVRTAVRASKLRDRPVVSVTAMSFLQASTPHLLLTGAEADASIRLWDLRASRSLNDRHSEPIAATTLPESHRRLRNFGLTSMVLNGDCSRLYTLCKDNSIYAYSTAHLVLGNAPEYRSGTRWGRSEAVKQGLGPLYCFRHPKLRASTFYVKSALRTSTHNHQELIAVGSTDECAVVFPTDERFLRRRRPASQYHPSTMSTPPEKNSTASVKHMTDEIPVFNAGAALERGHEKEVTGLSWTSEGELVTVSDDTRCRLWRESPSTARSLRTQARLGRETLLEGWAEYAGAESDDEE